MHPEVLDQNMLALMSDRIGFLKDLSFYLAGGTGLALQLGHRKSFDFDFFSSRDFSPEELSALIKKRNLSTEGEMLSPGTLYCILEGVRASFLFYDINLEFPVLHFNSVNIADWRDVIIVIFDFLQFRQRCQISKVLGSTGDHLHAFQVRDAYHTDRNAAYVEYHCISCYFAERDNFVD
jgi:hypothetical protein